jgi:hypothetical protein
LALDLKDVRYQVANYLVNTEHFYSLRTKSLIQLLIKIMTLNLYNNDPVFKHLIHSIQMILAQQATQITGAEFKKLISLHSIIPVHSEAFLLVLLKASQALAQSGEFQSDEQEVFNLNLGQINLSEISDPVIIENYNNCIAMNFKNMEEVNFFTIFEFLLACPAYANYGFHQGFGKTLFNLILALKRSESFLMANFTKLHMLGVKDPVFKELAENMLAQNAQTFANNSNDNYVILYNWWDLHLN